MSRIGPNDQRSLLCGSSGRPGRSDRPAEGRPRRFVGVQVSQKVLIRGYNPTYEGTQGNPACPGSHFKSEETGSHAGADHLLERFEGTDPLCERLGIPVATTLWVGGFPGNHTLSLGMLGMHGTYRGHMAVDESDLLIAVGPLRRSCDREARVLRPAGESLHIDIDPTSISKNVRVDLPNSLGTVSASF